MHLIVAIQESHPGRKATGFIGDFIRKISQKQYKAPFVSESWARIRPREIKIYDFTIPAAAEEEVLKDLVPYTGGNLQKLSKIANIPLLKGIISNTLGVKSVDMDKYKAKVVAEGNKKRPEVPVYITVLGKVEDRYTEDGIEMI
jgi:hypothetical protein